ncbi:MAG: hypothetical protein M3Z16_01745, partial [Pseudomonadota bacterium]|nr:hypothetical protein [Pseudomonadota bacterium]
MEEAPASSSTKSLAGGDAKALVGIPFIPEVPLVTTRVTIKNKANVALRFVQGSSKLENRQASFTKPPPVDIAGPSEGDFSITNESKVPLVPRLGGTGGEIRYDIVGDEKKAQLFLKWERGAIPDRNQEGTITPKDDRFEIIARNTGGDDFQFDFAPKGGTPPPNPSPNPGPNPNPTPNPAPTPVPANVPSGCLITVINETGQTLKRAEAKHERGDFMQPPARTVAPGATISFVSVETPNAKEQGCKGFVVWEVGAPASAVWRIEWDNPEGAK